MVVVVCVLLGSLVAFGFGSPGYWVHANLLLLLNTASNVPRAVAKEFQPVLKGHLVESGWRSWKEVEFGSLERSSIHVLHCIVMLTVHITLLTRVKPWLYNMHCHPSKYDSSGCSCNHLRAVISTPTLTLHHEHLDQ
jgi:hypothetical protein